MKLGLRYICILSFLGSIGISLALYTSSDDVISLTESNFEKRVLDSDEVWVVEFYAPWCGHCKAFASEYKKAATALKGIVNVGGVNCDEEKGLASRFGISGFPTVKIFGANKRSPQDYQGSRSAQGVVDEALSTLRKAANERLSGGSGSGSGSRSRSEQKSESGGHGDASDVIQLDDSNFDKTVLSSDDMWLVEFFAPWCGHCKALAPEWAKAASELKGKVKVAAVDATVNTVLASRFEIKGFPTIKMFPPGTKSMSSVVDYDGPRESSGIVTWALDKLADTIPPPKVQELTSNSLLSETCSSNKPLCIIAILPELLDCDSKCRNNYISIMQDASKKFKKHQWSWMWTETNAYPTVESTFGLGSYFPIMVVVNVKKQVYAKLKRPFTVDGLSEFLSEVAFGRGATEPMKGALPEINERKPWDGKDAKIEAKEEEIDLSDVKLDEDDDLGSYKIRRKKVEL